MTKTPRIPLLEMSEWNSEARDVFAVMQGPAGRENGPRYDFILMLAQHPALTVPFLNYSRYLLLESTLDHRTREVVTLYVAWTCKSEYEWLSHVREGLQRGLTAEDFAAIRQGPSSPRWTDLERALLHLVDEMRDGHTISDSTWKALSSNLDHRGMMDLVFTTGHYIALSAIVNGLRVQPEPGDEGAALAEAYGRP